jgi:VIT1/CCC1 family predicted Fe2+/Mn2+ transporter
MKRKDTMLFGMIDGLNGTVGVLIGLLAGNASAKSIAIALASKTIASAISMGAAEYDSDVVGSPKMMRAKVITMGIGYSLASLLPGIGFFFSRQLGIVLFVPITIFFLFIMSQFRAQNLGWRRSIIRTLVIFFLAVGGGILASVLIK